MLVKISSKSCIVRPMNAPGLLRIGELSRRAGVSPELLRAWERRYGLLRPTRTPGGLRLYSSEDLERVKAMQRHLAEGLAAAQAASLASASARAEADAPPLAPDVARLQLGDALEAFDEPAAQAVLDRLLSAATVEVVLAEVILPYLRELGERWERGEISVAQEHFASNVIRGRLLALARGWGRGVGPVALLACVPGEQHDLGLIAFGLALRSHGWRIAYLGADTPLDTLERAAEAIAPAFLVVSATADERIPPVARQLQALAKRYRVGLGGAAAAAADANRLGVLDLRGDPIAEAERIATLEQMPVG
jgi:MerR family transcriptional regulator, light-induced transcriptional regulator